MNGEKAQGIRVTLSKEGALRYLSHRDLMRLVERAARRAELPLALTAGFTPHPKMRFGRALKVGETSRSFAVDLFLSDSAAPQSVKKLMNEQLPAEVQVLEAMKIGLETPAPQ